VSGKEGKRRKEREREKERDGAKERQEKGPIWRIG